MPSASEWSSPSFFNDPAPTEIYTLSLHDALPISLSPPALEAVARKSRWWVVDPGHVAIRQGERGDAYYVIEHGRFQVDVDGRPARILDSPGEGFGEIALLR